MAQVILAATVVVLLAVLAWQNRGRLPRRRPRGEPCEVCGRQSRRNETLTSSTDRSGGGVVGGSSISATFCPEHLP